MKKAERPERCMAAKFLRHVGDRPANRHPIYAHCDRPVHEDEAAHHFVDPYGRTA
jgi:hypothetical protein